MSSLPTSITDGDTGHIGHHEELHDLIGSGTFALSELQPVFVDDYTEGDGSTDDSQGILNAAADVAAEGGRLHFGPKVHYISSSVVIERSQGNILVTFDAGAEIKSDSDDVNIYLRIKPSGVDNIKNCHIRGPLTVRDMNPGVHTSEESHGASIEDCDGASIIGVHGIDIGDEVAEATRCTDVILWDNTGEGSPSVDSGGSVAGVNNCERFVIGNTFGRDNPVGQIVHVRATGAGNATRNGVVWNAQSYGSSDNGVMVRAGDDAIVENVDVVLPRVHDARDIPVNIFRGTNATMSAVNVHSPRIVGGGEDAAGAPARRSAIYYNNDGAATDARITDPWVEGWGAVGEANHHCIVLHPSLKVYGGVLDGAPGHNVFQEGGHIEGTEVRNSVASGIAHTTDVDEFTRVIDCLVHGNGGNGIRGRNTSTLDRNRCWGNTDEDIFTPAGQAVWVLRNIIEDESIGSGAIRRGNIIGGVWEDWDSGSDSIGGGNTTVTVSHDLGRTPSVQITATNNNAAEDDIYVANKTTTSFDVVRTTSPPESAPFDWLAM